MSNKRPPTDRSMRMAAALIQKPGIWIPIPTGNIHVTRQEQIARTLDEVELGEGDSFEERVSRVVVESISIRVGENTDSDYVREWIDQQVGIGAEALAKSGLFVEG